MNISECINKRKELYDTILLFLENCTDGDGTNLFDFIEIEKLKDNRDELRELLHILSSISKNHFRCPDIINKFEQILSFLSESIKQTFSNFEIFNIFKNNKRILLFLFEAQIISPDLSIIRNFLKKEMKEKNYHLYFYDFIKSFNDQKIIEDELLKTEDETFLYNFDSKRKIGENESYLSSLIRKDSIDEFIIYINQNNLSLSSEINPSIFETNSFLLKNKNTTLIEYAAFFGSIQIFQYLKLNKVQLKQLLWLYAIHGKNAEIISILEECNVKLNKKSYEKCIKEAIKCHHNDIANYLQNNLNVNLDVYGLKYHNYEFIPNDMNFYSVFSDLCKYDYFSIVKLLILKDELKLKDQIIFFMNDF